MKKIISTALAAMMVMGAMVAMPITSAAEDAKITVDQYDTEWLATAEAVKGNGTTFATNESIAISDIYDLLAFNKLCNKDGGNVTYINVHLTADIDMANVEWTMANIEYSGTFDGRGFAIKNLTNAKNEGRTDTQYTGSFFDYVHNKATVKDISFINATATGGAFTSLIARATAGDARFENVYVQGSVTGTAHANSTFVGQVASGTTTFVNCVSDVVITSKGYGAGFVSVPNSAASIVFEDCVMLGEVICSGSDDTYSTTGCAGFVSAVGGSKEATAVNMTFKRCVSMAKNNDKADWYAPLFFIIKGGNTAAATINVEDCYVASSNGYVVNSKHPNTNYAMNVKFGGETVYTVANGTKIADKLNEINAAFATNGGYITNGETVNVTADNFGQKCAALAKAGWVVTGETVARFLPAAAAEQIDAPVATAPNATSYLQIKNGTDGKYDVRFIGAVNADDLAAYETVGFVVVVKLNGTAIMTETVETKAVYTSIKADGVDVTAEALGADYLNVLQIAGFKAENAYDISVLSFAKRADGTVIYDYAGALEVTVQNAAVAQ